MLRSSSALSFLFSFPDVNTGGTGSRKLGHEDFVLSVDSKGLCSFWGWDDVPVCGHRLSTRGNG